VRAVCRGKMQARGVTRAKIIATEACRLAVNGPAFVERVHREDVEDHHRLGVAVGEGGAAGDREIGLGAPVDDFEGEADLAVLSDEAIERTIDALAVCRGKMQARGVTRAKIIATAMRENASMTRNP
jgi:hypothetical protein